MNPGLGFSTPTSISLGGSSEPFTASPDDNPLCGKVVNSLDKKSFALKEESRTERRQFRFSPLCTYCTDLFSFTLFLHSGKVKIESGTENEAGTICKISFGREYVRFSDPSPLNLEEKEKFHVI